jgi:hypothetical protein
MSTPWIAVMVVQWIVIVVLSLVQIGIFRRLLPILERTTDGVLVPPSGPRAGTALPEFAATLEDGETITLAQIVGRPFVLLFVRQGCEPCRRLLDRLQKDTDVADAVPVYAVVDPHHLPELPLPVWVTPLLEPGGRISRLMQITATPMAVAVDTSGTVTESLVPSGPTDLHRLMDNLRPDRIPR